MLSSRLLPLSALAATFVAAQPASELVNPPGKPTLEQLKAAALEAEAKLPEAKAEPKGYFELSDARRERLTKYLPRTLLKLNRRERVHVVVLGDSMLDGAQVDEGVDPLLRSFPGVFARQLANQFYYTGGVRAVRAGSSLASKERPLLGPEIVLQPVTAASMVQATAAFTSEGFQGLPDLVLVALGFEDGLSGTPLMDVESGLRGLIAAARAKKIEVIVSGPMLQAAEPAEASLALTRGVSSMLRDVCADESVLFADLGDLSRLIAPPQGLAEAFRSFPVLARQYQTRLHVEPENAVSLATTELHQSMGTILFEDVMDGAPAVPWEIQNVSAKSTASGKLELKAGLRNGGKTPLTLSVLPLHTLGAKPKDSTPEITLAAGASQTISIGYALTDVPEEKVLRLPLLVISGSIARIHDLTVPVLPVGVAVNSRTTFNHEGVFNPGIEIIHQGDAKAAGGWEVQFQGKKYAGKLALDAGGQETLDLKLDLGLKADSPVRQKVPLGLQIDLGGQKNDFTRQIEIVRNLGLKQPVPLSAADGKETAAKLQFDADGQKLFVTCELNGLDLIDDGDTGRAFDATLQLDARRYGQRLTPGATAAIRIHGKASDGDVTVEKLAVWAFGTGYAANYDEKEIKAAVTSTPDGLRRLTISLPRSYLYDHEWALNNGNSQLGVNFTLRAA
ncbi:MAG: SGNH/GDSL hydrolase family protein, partial [Verrucomicrobiaceae bacterium]|nr:SGNH/GDSL hydrolase family protein [Verrucomicrobiaceae bacterium]